MCNTLISNIEKIIIKQTIGSKSPIGHKHHDWICDAELLYFLCGQAIFFSLSPAAAVSLIVSTSCFLP